MKLSNKYLTTNITCATIVTGYNNECNIFLEENGVIMEPEKREIGSQMSWIISNENIELGLTEKGGHTAPVFFNRNSGRSIQPYYINPWANEKLELDEPVLEPLRGNFFCLPFGGDNRDGADNHRVHGETSYGKWDFSSYEKLHKRTTLELIMNTHIRAGRVVKRISLIDGQNCIYTQHQLEGFEGKMPLGHHAILRVPDAESSIIISTSPIKFGITNPVVSGYYTGGEYYSLQAGKTFQSLDKVPTIWKDHPYTDCSLFPQREGFVDILQIFSKETTEPAWTAAAVPSEGYLWFSLKSQAVLPSTVIWMENHGRHQNPWKSRNRALGLEDVCAYLPWDWAALLKKTWLMRKGFQHL